MKRIIQAKSNERLQYMALGVASLGTAGAPGLLSLSQSTPLQRYFGRVSFLPAVAVVSVLGIVTLSSVNG